MILVECGMKTGQIFTSHVDGKLEDVEREMLSQPVIQMRGLEKSVWITSSEVAFISFTVQEATQ